jgi:hypothetical protein
MRKKESRQSNFYQSGQALLLLMIFLSVSIIITSAAAMVTVINLQSTSKFETSRLAYSVAESGIEDALLRLLRDPSYTGGTVTINGGTATITVTGDTTKTITSEGVLNNFHRKIQVLGSYNNTVFTISSWNEVN